MSQTPTPNQPPPPSNFQFMSIRCKYPPKATIISAYFHPYIQEKHIIPLTFASRNIDSKLIVNNYQLYGVLSEEAYRKFANLDWKGQYRYFDSIHNNDISPLLRPHLETRFLHDFIFLLNIHKGSPNENHEDFQVISKVYQKLMGKDYLPTNLLQELKTSYENSIFMDISSRLYTPTPTGKLVSKGDFVHLGISEKDVVSFIGLWASKNNVDWNDIYLTGDIIDRFRSNFTTDKITQTINIYTTLSIPHCTMRIGDYIHFEKKHEMYAIKHKEDPDTDCVIKCKLEKDVEIKRCIDPKDILEDKVCDAYIKRSSDGWELVTYESKMGEFVSKWRE